MSSRFKIIFILSVVLLQMTVLPHFTILGIIPNYVFVVICAMTIISCETECVVYAALTGMVMDLMTGAPIGVNTLLYMYISIGIIMTSAAIYNKRARIVFPICFASSLVYELLLGIFSTLLRRGVFHINAIVDVVLPSSVVNCVIFIPVYMILSGIRFEKKRKGIKYERQI